MLQCLSQRTEWRDPKWLRKSTASKRFLLTNRRRIWGRKWARLFQLRTRAFSMALVVLSHAVHSRPEVTQYSRQMLCVFLRLSLITERSLFRRGFLLGYFWPGLYSFCSFSLTCRRCYARAGFSTVWPLSIGVGDRVRSKKSGQPWHSLVPKLCWLFWESTNDSKTIWSESFMWSFDFYEHSPEFCPIAQRSAFWQKFWFSSGHAVLKQNFSNLVRST